MNIHQVLSVITIAKTQSISGAAEALFMSQPAVSLQLKNLEEELGFSVFNRTSKGLVLTEKGQLFYDDALQVYNSWNKLNRHVHSPDKPKKEIRIGIGTRVYSNQILPKLIEFSEMHFQYEVTYLTNINDAAFELLKNDNIDLAIDRLPPDDMLIDADLYFVKPLLEEQDCIIVSDKHPLSGRRSVTYEMLHNMNIITGTEHSARAKMTNALFNKHRIKPAKIYRMDNIESIKSIIFDGNGILLGPTSFAELFNAIAIPIEPSNYTSLNFICLKSDKDKKEISEMLRFIEQSCL